MPPLTRCGIYLSECGRSENLVDKPVTSPPNASFQSQLLSLQFARFPHEHIDSEIQLRSFLANQSEISVLTWDIKDRLFLCSCRPGPNKALQYLNITIRVVTRLQKH